jgi:acetate kinase
MDRFFPTSWEGKMTKGHKLTLGLKGLWGVSNDVRELEKSADPKAAFALEYFVYRAGPLAGMLAAALSGLDAFVSTAGIGENSAMIRARIAERLGWLGVGLDPKTTTAGAQLISRKDSHVAVYVVLMIARHTLELIGGKRRHPHERAAE